MSVVRQSVIMRVRECKSTCTCTRSILVLVFTCLLTLVTRGAYGAVPPAAVGDAVYNAATSLNQVSQAIKRLQGQYGEHAAIKHAIGRLRQLPTRAARVAHVLVDRLRVGRAPRVKTALGVLRGRKLITKTDPRREYYGFKGIRYAQPPTGMFRFRAPRPLEPWQGTRDALEEGSVCPHRFILFDNYKGEEDCLFLNVYTTALPNKETGYNPKLPVMVWFHGGGFAMGSGNAFLYGPDYLISEDVVLVTINYRLGALGYLSLETEEVPGNAGLKDQVTALKWVRDNIEFFGGDPHDVTIFGESAGSASVQYLMMSPLAQGLFHKAISQSGWTLSPWAYIENPRDRAFALGKSLGSDTNNTDQLLGFLRAVSPENLVTAANKILTKEDMRNNIGLPFVPTKEVDRDGNRIGNGGSFLPATPDQLLKEGRFSRVPYLTGFNTHEGLVFIRKLRKDPSLLEQLDKDFVRMVPLDLRIPGGRETPEGEKVADLIRDFYLQGRNVSHDTVYEMVYLLTDLMFTRAMVTSIRLQKSAAPETPIYVYRFGFDGALGLFKRMLGINNPGTCHGDEMGYLFKFSGLNVQINKDSKEYYVKKRMVRMWTNFAKYGNPTPVKDDVIDFKWLPVSSKNLTAINYLDISSEFEPKIAPEEDRIEFWDALYSKYNGENWWK